MAETIRIDDWFYEWVRTEKCDDETMGAALVRLTGAPAPDPDTVSGVISRDDGEWMKARIEGVNAFDIESRF